MCSYGTHTSAWGTLATLITDGLQSQLWKGVDLLSFVFISVFLGATQHRCTVTLSCPWLKHDSIITARLHIKLSAYVGTTIVTATR